MILYIRLVVNTFQWFRFTILQLFVILSMVICMTKLTEIYAGSPANVDTRKIEKAMQKAFVTVQQAAAQQRELFAERLRTLRNNAGLTQAQLAEKAGMDRALITRYETGNAMPRKKAIERLAAALNVASAALDVNIAYDVFDIALLRRHGITVRLVQTGLYVLSLPGCHDIILSARDLSNLWEESGDETMKVFNAALESYAVNLLMRSLYEQYAADQNASDTPAD